MLFSYVVFIAVCLLSCVVDVVVVVVCYLVVVANAMVRVRVVVVDACCVTVAV